MKGVIVLLSDQLAVVQLSAAVRLLHPAQSLVPVDAAVWCDGTRLWLYVARQGIPRNISDAVPYRDVVRVVHSHDALNVGGISVV